MKSKRWRAIWRIVAPSLTHHFCFLKYLSLNMRCICIMCTISCEIFHMYIQFLFNLHSEREKNEAGEWATAVVMEKKEKKTNSYANVQNARNHTNSVIPNRMYVLHMCECLENGWGAFDTQNYLFTQLFYRGRKMVALSLSLFFHIIKRSAVILLWLVHSKRWAYECGTERESKEGRKKCWRMKESTLKLHFNAIHKPNYRLMVY